MPTNKDFTYMSALLIFLEMSWTSNYFSELFCLKDTKKFAALLFFVRAGNKKFQPANALPYAYDANKSTRRLVEDGINTGLTSTHTAPGCQLSSVSPVRWKTQCILFSTLRLKSYLTLLCYIDSRFFLPLELSRTSLLGCRLAALRFWVAARWQLDNRIITSIWKS